jgi:cytochrome c biogenesis protein CcmG/thiol:disulfide interchange protein DsbE
VSRVRLAGLALLACLACGREATAPAAEPPAAGEPATLRAPDFTLEDLAGGKVSLAALRGRPVIVDFWATWCAPCERQVPVLNAFHDTHGDRIPVLGIAVDVDGSKTVAPFVAEHGLRYRVLLGDEDLAQQYRAFGFPTLYVIRPDGTIHSAHVGVVTPEALEAAVAEWASPASAPAAQRAETPPSHTASSASSPGAQRAERAK